MTDKTLEILQQITGINTMLNNTNPKLRPYKRLEAEKYELVTELSNSL